MEKATTNKKDEYIRIDEIPEDIASPTNIDIRILDIKQENNYVVYKCLDIDDIDILITNSHRIDEPWKKIEEMQTLSYYMDPDNKEEYSKLNSILNSVSNDEINEIENKQKEFIKSIPSQVKYSKDYLWQIYYIQRTNRYVMIVPTEETEYQAFIYLLKKKIEAKKQKIYVPICNGNYENTYIGTAKIKKIESNLYYFTNHWPLITESTDQIGNLKINIIGKINLYANIVSDYKMEFEDKETIGEFYDFIEKLFYIQTELSNYFKFDKYIDENGGIHFYYNNIELTNSSLIDFYKDEISKNLKSIKEVEKIQTGLINKLNELKKNEKELNNDLLYKQKQISTFLECKKSFFGKFKYFFKYSKKSKHLKRNYKEVEDEEELSNSKPHIKESNTFNNDIDDLVYVCKQLKSKTLLASTTRMDIQNITVKIDVLKKKIENATAYIREIESHKKSIFDFWKYTNKDEKAQLTEAETIKEKEVKKIEKTLDYKEDFKDFAKKIDNIQRKTLNNDECNDIYLGTTCILNDINNLIISGKITNEVFEKIKETDDLVNINTKALDHRERKRNIDNILKISAYSTFDEYKTEIKNCIKNIDSAFKKSTCEINIPAYSLEKPDNIITRFELDPSKLIDNNEEEIVLYKVNTKKDTHIITFSNIIFYENRYDTLPLGMDYSSCALVDLRKEKLLEIKNIKNNIINLHNNTVTKLNIIEYDV